MKITDYELFEVPPRWVFLRLETDVGVVGWGEPIVEGHAKTIVAAVERIIDNYLLGKDPMEIERHWQTMYRGFHFRGGPVLMSAIGGIDQALWDIKGKHYGAPVYELLGGRACDRTRVYQWIGGETPAEVSTAAARAVEQGYGTVKMAPISKLRRIDTPAVIDEAGERVAAVREEVGDDVDVAVDFRGQVSKGMAKRLMAELDQYDPLFYEEPVLPEHFDALPRLEAHTKTPLASGERLYSRWDFQEILHDGAIDIIQPNPSHAGGITEVKKIANAAETSDVTVALHCPVGPVSFAACLHVDAVTPNTFIQNQHLDVHDPTDNDLLSYLEEPSAFGFEDGYVFTPEAPGLGVEVDESVLRNQAEAGMSWQSPIWYYEDGSVAEW